MQRTINLLGYMEPGRLEAGCDEAGRGPLAGPVYAAAVILPQIGNDIVTVIGIGTVDILLLAAGSNGDKGHDQ